MLLLEVLVLERRQGNVLHLLLLSRTGAAAEVVVVVVVVVVVIVVLALSLLLVRPQAAREEIRIGDGQRIRTIR